MRIWAFQPGIKAIGLLLGVLLVGRAHALEFVKESEDQHTLRSQASLLVVNRLGKITLIPWAQSRIKVKMQKRVQAESQTEADSRFEQMGIRFQEKKGAAEVHAVYGKGQELRERLAARKLPSSEMDLVIWAPARMELKLWGIRSPIEAHGFRASLEVRSQEGAVRVSDWQADRVNIDCVSCAVNLEDIRASVRVFGGAGSLQATSIQGKKHYFETTGVGALQLKSIEGALMTVTQAGPVHVADFSGSFEFRTKSGSVRAENGKGEASGQTDSGPVSLKMSQWDPRDKSFIRTDSGEIELIFPVSLSTDLHAVSAQGEVRSEFRVLNPRDSERPGGSVIGRIREGGEDLRVSSQSGNIRLRRQGAG